MADNFKAHADKHGPKLGDSRLSGLSGLVRRYAVLKAEDDADVSLRPSDGVRAHEVGFEAGRPVKVSPPRSVPGASRERKGGRPVKVGRPWEAEGISRTEWYRRRGDKS